MPNEDEAELPPGLLRRDDVVLVTGAASGVGAACMAEVIGQRATAIGLDIAEPPAASDRAWQRCDVTSSDSLAEVVDGVLSDYGKITKVIHCAARFTGWTDIVSLSDLEVEETVRVNVLGSIQLARAVLPALRRSRGSALFVGSVGGTMGLYGDAVYAATKASLLGLTRSLAVTEAGYGVRVNLLAPGNILTPPRAAGVRASPDPEALEEFLNQMAWTGRSSEPREIARAAVVLLSDVFPNLTGASLNLTGGMELGAAPRYGFDDWLRQHQG
jgi:NAD(P)-dependent dehydrogenase (short-subunit alcohol dehydrogenase family)